MRQLKPQPGTSLGAAQRWQRFLIRLSADFCSQWCAAETSDEKAGRDSKHDTGDERENQPRAESVSFSGAPTCSRLGKRAGQTRPPVEESGASGDGVGAWILR